MARKAGIEDYLRMMLGPQPKQHIAKTAADMLFGGIAQGPPANASLADRAMYALAQPGVMPVGAFKMTPDIRTAIQSTPTAKLIGESGDMADAVEMALHRRQLEAQAGMPSVRSGVFFAPGEAAGNPFLKHYTGRYGYGGPQRISTSGRFEKPIIVKAGTGGRGPELAFDQVKGKGAYEAMRSEFLKEFMGYGKQRDPRALADFLKRHGGDPDLADEILAVSTKGNQLPYAVQENIVANVLRSAGHDAVLSYSKRKGQPVLSEVFDLTRTHYPEP